jgi:hypothetical protein
MISNSYTGENPFQLIHLILLVYTRIRVLSLSLLSLSLSLSLPLSSFFLRAAISRYFSHLLSFRQLKLL